MVLVNFLFARLVFGVKVEGSMLGFLGVSAAFALMTAGFGMLVASLGKTPEATRGLAIFATLIVVMLGGAWIPMFLFPQWLQKLTLVVPTRWAMDGFEAMTWRGLESGSCRGAYRRVAAVRGGVWSPGRGALPLGSGRLVILFRTDPHSCMPCWHSCQPCAGLTNVAFTPV